MSLAIDGLVSGLNTTELIQSLMTLESQPRELLKDKSSAASQLVSALQALNTKVSSLGVAASKAADAKSWDLHKATSSSTSVTVSTSTGALPATLEFRVDRLAASQVSMLDTDAISTLVGKPETTLTVTRPGSAPGTEPVNVTLIPADAEVGLTLDDIAKAINTSTDAQVRAAKVKVGVDDAGAAVYSLQFTGQAGAANAFELSSGGRELSLDTRVTASDAQVTLWPGSDGPDGQPIQLTSGSNSFSDVLPGVTFTVTKTTATDEPAVRLNVTADEAGMSKVISDVVSNVGVVLAEIASRTATTTTTADDGRAVVTGGLFTGDAAIRFLADDLRSAVSNPVNGRSPAEIGISLERSGEVSFDAAKFAAAMSEDPEGTQAFAMAIAARVAEVGEKASDTKEGTLTLKIQSQESLVSDLRDRIADWDRRLEVRRTGLQRTYTALEVTLGNLNSQSSWLASQLSTLPTYSSQS